MAFPQYRIPIERLKEDWALRKRMERLRLKRAPQPPSKITDNSEPWIRNPSSVAEFWEIACKTELFGMIDALSVRECGYAAVCAGWTRLDPHGPAACVGLLASRHDKARERRWPKFPV